MARKSGLETVNTVATLLGGMLIVAALYVARDVFIPLALAVLLSFLLSPLVDRIQRLGVGNVIAVLGTAVMVFVLLASSLTFVGRELSALVSDIPHYRSELVSKARGLSGLRSAMGETFTELTKEVTAAIDEPPKVPLEETAVTPSTESDNPAGNDSLSPMERFANRFLPSVRNFDRMFVKFRKAGANFMTTSFNQTAAKLAGFKSTSNEPVSGLVPQLLATAR